MWKLSWLITPPRTRRESSCGFANGNGGLIYNDRNVGFAAGQNQAIRAAKGEWLLCLNPDVLLADDFVRCLIEAGEAHPEAGSICGKLLRWDPVHEPHQTRIIDSTGIYFTRNMRHLDRGAEETDVGQYDRAQYVFGATGAAAMFRRAFVEAVSVDGEFFDEEFFSYREDADLAWRAQVMGWKCVYTPAAVAWHVRRVTPERREQLPLVINWHSMKNRFLMRGKKCLRLALLEAVLAGGVARPHDRRLCRGARPPVALGDCLSLESARQHPPQTGHHPIAPQGLRPDLIWWFSDIAAAPSQSVTTDCDPR